MSGPFIIGGDPAWVGTAGGGVYAGVAPAYDGGSPAYVNAPSWHFDLRSGTLPVGSTFTRASSGWYFDSTGTLVSASSNVPRFDYDPVTLQPLGYLAEMQSTNAVANSQALTGLGWTATGLTVTDSAVVSPDGATNAARLVETSATSTHLDVYTSVTVTSGNTYGVSLFAKNVSGSRWLQWSFVGGSFANFNPTTGALGSTGNGGGMTVAGTSARQLSNGWWRFSITLVAAGTGPSGQAVGLVQTSNAVFQQSYAGDGASAVSVWGLQFETAGVGVTSYIPTAGSTVTRAVDILSLPLTSLPGWNASNGGVLVSAYRMNTSRPGSGVQAVAGLSDGPFNNAVVMYENLSGVQFLGRTIAGGVLNDLPGANSAALFARRKTAFGWGPSRHQIAHDGIFDASNAGQTLPIGMANLRIGTDDGTNSLNGTLESIAYYAGDRSDAFIQQVSR